VSEAAGARLYSIPWFKRYLPDLIAEHALAYRKVAENYRDLLDGDSGNPPDLGNWFFFG
jgi:hypothetical protein